MKKIAKKFICSIICLCLSIIGCIAITERNYWWGTEYYAQAHEIASLRWKLQEMFNWVSAGNAIFAGAVGFQLAGPPGALAGEIVTAAQQIAMNRLITDLECWEYRGRAIIVSLPGAIQGWNIREQ